ncbi:MAG: CpaE family protein [Blastocatellia bacterium]
MKRQITTVIFSAGPEGETELRQALKNDPRVRIVACNDQMEQAYAEVIHWRPAAAIIMLNGKPELGWMLSRQINAVCPETVIICASRDSSPDVILESLRAGSREFLRLPVVIEELLTVFDRVAELSAGSTQSLKKQGRVVAVFSNKGGCGASFIASNLAVSLNAPTLLVDLNLQSGSQDLLLGVKPKYSIVDLVDNRSRLDDQLLSSYVVPYSANLSLLAAPRDIEEADRLQTEPTLDVLSILRTKFDYLVIDLPHTFDPLTIGALDLADDVLLVLTLDILASRAAQRALTIFYRLGYSRQKIRLILNRWSKQSDLELRHVEKFLGERMTCFVSEDARAVIRSINLGQPLAATDHATPIALEFKKLAAMCGATSENATAPRKTLLNAIFRRQTGALEPAPSLTVEKAVTHKLGT